MYFSNSSSSRPKSFTSSWPETESVSFRMPLISSLAACASRVSDQRVLPARRVGSVNSGMMTMPMTAMRGERCIIITTAAVRVMPFERMEEKVEEMTRSTPEMSEVMRVMMSPWLEEVKNRWGICCRWRYICARMSQATCWAIQLFR